MTNWRDVIGYKGIYEVSNKGEVRSKEGKKTHSVLHGERLWKQRVLKAKRDKKGYLRVTLYKSGKPKDFLVHRLVAKSFINRVKGKDIINHLDGNPSNNNESNLEWSTYEENSNHAFDMGLMVTNKVIYLANLKTKEVTWFRSMAKAGEYLGRNKGYVSALLKRNQYCIGDYHIYKGE